VIQVISMFIFELCNPKVMLLDVVLPKSEDNHNVAEQYFCNRDGLFLMNSGNNSFLLNTKYITVITKVFYLFQSPAK